MANGFNPYKFQPPNRSVVNPQGTEPVIDTGGPIIRQSFTKGVMSSYDPSAIPPDAVWDALNVYPDVSGVIRSRRGTANFLPSFGQGTPQECIEAFGGLLLAWNKNLYLIQDDGTHTELLTGSVGTTSTQQVGMQRWTRSAKEIAYIATGKGIYETDGKTASLSQPYIPASGEQINLLLVTGTYAKTIAIAQPTGLGAAMQVESNMQVKADGGKTVQDASSGPYACTIAHLRGNLSQRMCMTGNPNLPNTIYFSAPLDATYYPANQVLQLPDDGGKIVGLIDYFDYLLIFRDTGLWIFEGSDCTDPSAKLYSVPTAPGCVSGRTIVSVPNIGIMYLSVDNLWQIEHQWGAEDFVIATPLGDNVRNYIESAVTDSGSTATAVYFNREYRVCFPDTLQDQAVIRLNLLNSAAWYLDSAPRVSRYVAHKGTLYAISNNSGSIDKFTEDLTDNGGNIPVSITFRRESLEPGPSRIKRIFLYAMSKGRSLTGPTQFFGSSFGSFGFDDEIIETANTSVGTEQDLSISVIIDGTTFTEEDFTVIVGKTSSFQHRSEEPVKVYEIRFHPHAKGHFLKIEVQSTVPGQDIAIFGYGIEYTPRGRIHGERMGVS